MIECPVARGSFAQMATRPMFQNTCITTYFENGGQLETTQYLVYCACLSRHH